MLLKQSKYYFQCFDHLRHEEGVESLKNTMESLPASLNFEVSLLIHIIFDS